MAFDALEYGRDYRRKHATRLNDLGRERRRRVLDVVSEIKLAAGCVDCGYNVHPKALDFDHLGDDKVADVSKLIQAGRSLEVVLAEIAKCEVVCANCHRIRTSERPRGNVIDPSGSPCQEE